MESDGQSVFVEYEKMPEDTNWWTTRKLASIKKWIALEKVHGANFSFIVKQGSDEVLVAKRGSLLTQGEEFFGVWRQKGLLEVEREKAKRVFAGVQLIKEGIVSITIYGELFGGYYPHASVPGCVGVVPVQRAVAYCPGLNFYAYDIAVVQAGGGREYLDYDVCVRLFLEAGFLYATPLCTGTLQQMLNYPLGFDTTIPHRLGLPPLPGNTAEGVVVRPVRECVLVTAAKGPCRVIFKRKVEQFVEKHSRPPPTLDKPYLMDDKELMRIEMLALITFQRVVNTVSKHGRPCTEEGWGQITDHVVEEVLDILRGEQGPLWLEHEAIHQVELRQECSRAVDGYRCEDTR